MTRKAPEQIGKFKITGTIGKGGMGDVYKAIQEPLGRTVAVKVLPEEFCRNEEFLQRFSAEAEAVAKLEHQNIVGLYDFGTEGNLKYIAMRYVDGINLAEKLEKTKTLEIEDAIDYIRQICRALKYAHSRNIIHRDIKPQNILINKENRVFITDFGIAKLYHQTGFTKTGVVVGTPEYMSPEQAEGVSLNQQTDIYSVGIVLFEMLTGTPPFTGENPLSIAYKHVNTPPPKLSEKRKDIPKRLELVVMKALKKDRNFRHKSIDEFLKELDTIYVFEKDDVNVSDKTRDMTELGSLKKENLSESEKRIVDRRGYERRLGLRRNLSRRLDSTGITKWKVILICLLCMVAGGALVYKFANNNNSIQENRNSISRIIGNGNPENILDNIRTTAWIGKGDNPSFAFEYFKRQKIKSIQISSGNIAGDGTFYNFARPKILLLIFDDNAEYEIELEDTRENQLIVLPKSIDMQKVKISIKDLFQGKVSNNVYITELKFGLVEKNAK